MAHLVINSRWTGVEWILKVGVLEGMFQLCSRLLSLHLLHQLLGQLLLVCMAHLFDLMMHSSVVWPLLPEINVRLRMQL